MSCTKRRQTDLLRFGKKRETLNPWSGHGGEAGSICFWNFNSMLVLGSICFAEFPRAKFRLHSTPHSPSSDKTLQTSPPPHVCLCVVTMRKKESTHSVQFYMQIIFFAQFVWCQVTKWNLMIYFPGKRRWRRRVPATLWRPGDYFHRTWPKSNHYCLALSVRMSVTNTFLNSLMATQC